jgi:hypothetical protein
MHAAWSPVPACSSAQAHPGSVVRRQPRCCPHAVGAEHMKQIHGYVVQAASGRFLAAPSYAATLPPNVVTFTRAPSGDGVVQRLCLSRFQLCSLSTATYCILQNRQRFCPSGDARWAKQATSQAGTCTAAASVRNCHINRLDASHGEHVWYICGIYDIKLTCFRS